jgi:hypothetical protein
VRGSAHAAQKNVRKPITWRLINMHQAQAYQVYGAALLIGLALAFHDPITTWILIGWGAIGLTLEVFGLTSNEDY